MPLPSKEPMKVARRVIQDHFTSSSTEGALNQIIWYRGAFWEFCRNRWERRDESWMRARVWQELEDAVIMVEKRVDGVPVNVAVRYAPDSAKVDNVVDALKALPEVWKEYKHVPVWLRERDSRPDPEGLIGFEDVLVPVVPGQGDLLARDATWFDPCTLPVPFVPGAPCNVWKACLKQWSCGVPEWEVLLQRWFGYCLMNHRRYAKWLLMKGKARAGKGTIARVLMGLLGTEGVKGCSAEDITKSFGLWGMETAKVISITEMDGEDRQMVRHMAALVKRLVGQDPQIIDIKYQKPLTNVVIPAAPMVQSNMIPRLPDIGGGLSSKMLILPFQWSTLDPGQKDDTRLDNKLRLELPGIAAWAVEGARALEMGLGFPELESALEDLEDYRIENSPMDSFLQDCFVKDDERFTASSIIWEAWIKWKHENLVDTRISRNRIRNAVKEGSSWALTPHRLHGSARGLKGLGLKDGVLERHP